MGVQACIMPNSVFFGSVLPTSVALLLQ